MTTARQAAQEARLEIIVRHCVTPMTIVQMQEIEGLKVSHMTLRRDLDLLMSIDRLRIAGSAHNGAVTYSSVNLNAMPYLRNLKGARLKLTDPVASAANMNWDRSKVVTTLHAPAGILNVLELARQITSKEIDPAHIPAALENLEADLKDMHYRLNEAAFVLEQLIQHPMTFDVTALMRLAEDEDFPANTKTLHTNMIKLYVLGESVATPTTTQPPG